MWYFHQWNDLLYNRLLLIIVAGVHSVRVVGYYSSIPTAFSVQYDSVLVDSSFSLSMEYDMIIVSYLDMEQ